MDTRHTLAKSNLMQKYTGARSLSRGAVQWTLCALKQFTFGPGAFSVTLSKDQRLPPRRHLR